MHKPEPSEYDPYYEIYISLVDTQDINGVLATQPAVLRQAFGELGEAKGTFAYAEGKWSIKDVLSHLIDGERMFGYRVFRISRGDQTPIEGFEQDGYIENARANGRSFADLLDEFELLRVANVLMFNNLNETDWMRVGTANKVEISVRALAYIMAGHVRHHVNILHERYKV
jgi:hypothetical protein